MVDKRGQGLSVNAIILIILGVVVLVVLIIGFTMGWDRIAPWISTSSNIDEVKVQCNVACSTGAAEDFCFKERTLKFEGTKSDLVNGNRYTCGGLSKILSSGVSVCSSITCQ